MLRLIRLCLTLLVAALAVACSLSAHSQSGVAPIPPGPPGVVERLEQRIAALEKRVALLEARR